MSDQPSKIQMAKNLAKDLANEGKQIVQGKEPVSQYEKERRLSLCAGCVYWNTDSKRCSRCGCLMEFKAGFRSVVCPIGKW
jgi:hypothetical protein